jgi:hypothetical protein
MIFYKFFIELFDNNLIESLLKSKYQGKAKAGPEYPNRPVC